MPLSKQSGRHRGDSNPFRDWWKIDDPDWVGTRRARWPNVHRFLFQNLSKVAPRIDAFRRYYLTGESEGLEGRVPIDLRMALVPWSTVEQCRQTAEAYVNPRERHLRTFATTVLYDGLIRPEGLPVERWTDSGVVRTQIAAEAIVPSRFTEADALSTRSEEEAYFQERGGGTSAKPLPFLSNYHVQGRLWLSGSERSRGRASFLNPCDHLREYYFSCLRYLEETGQTLPRLGALHTFLQSLCRLESQHEQDESTARVYANKFCQRLRMNDIPGLLKRAYQEAQDVPLKTSHEPARAEHRLFPHLKFRGKSKVEYEVDNSPDADSWVHAICRFPTVKKRDSVLKLLGEPGRPPWPEELESAEAEVYRVIANLPPPYRVRKVGRDGAFFEWCDWYSDHFDLTPLLEALKSLEPDLAFASEALFYDGDESRHYEVRSCEVRKTTGSDDPLWQRFLKLR